MLGFKPSTFCIQNQHSNHYTNCSHLVKDIISCSTCSCMITSNSMQCSLCLMWVHCDCTNLTMNQLVNLDNGVKYKCIKRLDIFPFHNSNNEFDNPCSNIDTNIEVNKWRCECSKLNVNICNNNYENNFCFNNIDPDNNFLYNVSMIFIQKTNLFKNLIYTMAFQYFISIVEAFLVILKK